MADGDQRRSGAPAARKAASAAQPFGEPVPLSKKAKSLVEALEKIAPFTGGAEARRLTEELVNELSKQSQPPLPRPEWVRRLEQVRRMQRAAEPLMKAAREAARLGEQMRAHHEAMREPLEDLGWKIRTAQAEKDVAELRRRGDAERADLRRLVGALVRQVLDSDIAPPLPWHSVKDWLWAVGVVDHPRRPHEKEFTRRGDCWCRRLAKAATRAGFQRVTPRTIKTYLHRGDSTRAG